MRIIFKFLAAPFVLALTLAVAVLSFLLSLSAGVLSITAFLLGIGGAVLIFFDGNVTGGIILLAVGFAASPFGLPALAGWLVDRLDDLNYTLRDFITG